MWVSLLQLRPEDKAPHVISLLLQKLNTQTADEAEWLTHTVAAMVEAAPNLPHSEQAMGVLKDSLTLEYLKPEFVQEQLLVSSHF